MCDVRKTIPAVEHLARSHSCMFELSCLYNPPSSRELKTLIFIHCHEVGPQNGFQMLLESLLSIIIPVLTYCSLCIASASVFGFI